MKKLLGYALLVFVAFVALSGAAAVQIHNRPNSGLSRGVGRTAEDDIPWVVVDNYGKVTNLVGKPRVVLNGDGQETWLWTMPDGRLHYESPSVISMPRREYEAIVRKEHPGEGL